MEILGFKLSLPHFGFKSKNTPVAAVAPSGDSVIINRIVQEFKDSALKNMQDWRLALELCNDSSAPKWYMLQDLYDYLEPDAQLGTSKDIRVAATLGKKFVIYDKKTGQDQPEKTDLFNKSWFFNFVWNFLDTVFKGYTVAQLTNPATMEFYYIPRRNVVPQKDFILFKISEDKGVKYTDPAFKDSVIVVKYKHAYGILNDIVPNLIWKKTARQAWAEFSEKFGIPLISATTDKRDKPTLDRIEAMLKAMGEAATAVLPVGTTITIHDSATKGDVYNVFAKQIALDDQQIAKRLLGGTMITDSGSSRSQSEVHERTLKEVISLFDKMLIVFAVNDYLLPMMARNGYPLTENDAFKFDESENLTLAEQWDIVNEALDHYELDQDKIAKQFNLPITGIKVKQDNTNFKQPINALASALIGKGITLPYYKAAHLKHLPHADTFTDNLLGELSDTLINEVWQGKDTLTTEVLKSIVSYRHMLDGLFEGWGDRAMQISYDSTDHHCLAMMEYNLFEFSRMKEKANVFALNQLLLDKDKNNIRSEKDFRDQSLKYLDNPDVNWLNTERNYAIAVGQNGSRYNQFMSERSTVTKYGIIQTVGDSRVRPKHQLLEGKIVSFDESGGLTMWTPFDIGCRCEILQHLGEPTKEQVYSSQQIRETIGKKQGDKWSGNRAAMEQVFTLNEQYINSQGLANEVAKLSYSNYSLPAIKDMKELPELKLDKSITTKNANELFKALKEKIDGDTAMGFEDYLKRKLVIKQETFAKASLDNKKIFPHIDSVLKEPDEVYFNKYEGKPGKPEFQANYVKFFNGQTVVVNTKLGSTNVEVNNWYTSKKEDFRNGYLIHAKTKKP